VNPLVFISVALRFEIKDAEMFGGKGSVGYSAVTVGGITDIAPITDEFIESKVEAIADLFDVPKDAVKLISKEEYDLETRGEEDE
jgi:hypothetical protein